MQILMLEFSGNCRVEFDSDQEQYFKHEKIHLLLIEKYPYLLGENPSQLSGNSPNHDYYSREITVSELRAELSWLPYNFPFHECMCEDVENDEIDESQSCLIVKSSSRYFCDCKAFQLSDKLLSSNDGFSWQKVDHKDAMQLLSAKNQVENPEVNTWAKIEEILKKKLAVLDPLSINQSFDDEPWLNDLGPITLLEAKQRYADIYERQLVTFLMHRKSQIEEDAEKRVKQLLPKGIGVQVQYHFASSANSRIDLSAKILLFDWCKTLQKLNLATDLQDKMTEAIGEIVKQESDCFLFETIGCFNPSYLQLDIHCGLSAKIKIEARLRL